MAKQLFFVTATINQSTYMNDDDHQYEVQHLVWAEDRDEVEKLLEQHYPTDEYAVYRRVMGVDISPVLGAPEGFLNG